MATERPNKKALDDALDIYRDAMRPFIIRGLKRVQGKKVENCVRTALGGRGQRYNQFDQDVSKGLSVEEAIDITDFPQLVKFYWKDVFRDAFKSCNEAKDDLHRIAEARNKVSHPGNQDIGLDYTLECLDQIAKVLAAINEPRQSKAVVGVKRKLGPFKTSAHRLRQGGRDVYAFTLDLTTLDDLLPDRLDDKVVKGANRPLTPGHAQKIQGYLEERSNWILGPLLLGVPQEAVGFRSYMSEANADNDVGELTISVGGAAKMMMFDGQHRRRAIKDALYGLSHNERNAQKLLSLKEASLPIMLYVESKIDALRQMFVDAANTKPIERNTVTRFDLTDSFNLAALEVSEISDLFNGRVEMERPSVSRNSEKIIAINQLAVALKALEVGYKGRISKDRNDFFMLDLESLYERCLTWTDDFMPAARDEYNNLMVGEVDNTEIPQMRNETMAYSAAVIRIIAGCYYEWIKDGDEWQPFADFLRNTSLRSGVHTDSLMVDAGVVAPGGTSPAARPKIVVNGIDYIVHLAEEVIENFDPNELEGAENKPTPRKLRKFIRAQGTGAVINEYKRLEHYRDSVPKGGSDWHERNASLIKFLFQWWEGTGPFQASGRFHGHNRC